MKPRSINTWPILRLPPPLSPLPLATGFLGGGALPAPPWPLAGVAPGFCGAAPGFCGVAPGLAAWGFCGAAPGFGGTAPGFCGVAPGLGDGWEGFFGSFGVAIARLRVLVLTC